uniref:AlNc14C9G1182 protein n=1 Tax=Albugo laibachii Nc14 TaxID=890382 RepID=F0W2D2_9STRA|nr:AlNc14C9G1182 [Albugo laibachii Nc14]|eukprot:CCA15217.1 AlNc14C9G1182 [Albugo laibachii Nc14]
MVYSKVLALYLIRFVSGKNNEPPRYFLRKVDHSKDYDDKVEGNRHQPASIKKNDDTAKTYFRSGGSLRRLDANRQNKGWIDTILNEKVMVGLSAIESLGPSSYQMLAPYIHGVTLPDKRLNKTADAHAHAIKLIANESILSSPLVNLTSELSSLNIKLQEVNISNTIATAKSPLEIAHDQVNALEE